MECGVVGVGQLEPEQLGSVTHNQEAEGSNTGLQIRSSARVSKKMRLDLTAPPSTVASPADVKPAELLKEEIRDGKPPRRRTWELWSPEDKDTFFEALNEFGKDFDSIQNHFLVKSRKKAGPAADQMMKNKDQIRHFYYRTWHKVSKHLHFSDDVKKSTQELYALVNYGELRKKLGCITEKTSLKLNELIHKGFTQVRSKGKTLRIKTPLCRALRRLNQMDECQEVIKLPARICVELRPRGNQAWARVQGTAHNPRVRAMLPLQKRLASVLAFLAHTWRPQQHKLRAKLLSTVECPADDREPLLRVAPREGAAVCLPAINLNEYLTSNVLSLNSYEERVSSSAKMAVKQRQAKGAPEGGSAGVKEEIGDGQVLDSATAEANEEIISNVRAGWTVNNAEAVTIGELYLMFGSDSRLQLDYWWEEPAPPLSSTLLTLLAVSRLHLRRTRVQCPCGHVCGGVAKPRPHPIGPPRPIRANDKLESCAVSTSQQADNSTRDGEFVRPVAPGDAFKAQLDKLGPRWNNRRGRTMRPKNVVVQRMLPLLPKAPIGQSVVSVLRPVMRPVLHPVLRPAVPTVQQLTAALAAQPAQPRPPPPDYNDPLPSLPSLDTPVSSPPSISHLLDLSGVADITLASASNFVGLLGNGEPGTPPTSPSRILKEAEDNQWLNSEVADFSLSSFLGHLESPLKHDQLGNTARMSDVDSQLQGLMTDTSVDYMAKFADLAAAQIASSSSQLNNKKSG